MSVTCGWIGCTEIGTEAQVGKDNQVWATLCKRHDWELRQAIKSGNVPKLLSAWIDAQGGAKKAAARM